MTDKKTYRDKAERIADALNYCDPNCKYNDWIAIGIALYAEGINASFWVDWSSRGNDAPSAADLERKYNSFSSRGEFGAGGQEQTIYKYAKGGGWNWRPTEAERETWKQNRGPLPAAPVKPSKQAKPKTLEESALETVAARDLTPAELPPETLTPAGQLKAYINALFKPGEFIAWTTQAAQNDNGKWHLIDNDQNITAAAMIQSLDANPDNINYTIGRPNKAAGAWIHINPTDGKGCKRENVSAFRHVLVESDKMTPEEQYAFYIKTNLPCAAIVNSGGKSVHAVVKIEAADEKEYETRVKFLYDYLERSGFKIDPANKNANRSSRLPGVPRGESRQYLLAVNTGAANYEAWSGPILDRGRKPDNTARYIEKQFRRDISHFQSDRKTGFDNLDRCTGGLYAGLYVIAAISSLGKTTFCHQLGEQLAERGHDIIFFSLEQSRFELVSKSIARRINTDGINSITIRKGRDRDKVEAAASEYVDAVQDRYSIIEGNFNCTVSYIKQYVAGYIERTGTRPIVFVDYLQAVAPEASEKRQSTRETVDNTVIELKRLSRDLDLTVLVISSVNRANYLTPIDFESLKESGGIEYSADVVFGLQLKVLDEELFRSEKKITEKRERVKEAKKENPRRLQLVCLKNRFGIASFDVDFNYYPAKDLFEEHSLADDWNEWKKVKANETPFNQRGK